MAAPLLTRLQFFPFTFPSNPFIYGRPTRAHQNYIAVIGKSRGERVGEDVIPFLV